MLSRAKPAAGHNPLPILQKNKTKQDTLVDGCGACTGPGSSSLLEWTHPTTWMPGAPPGATLSTRVHSRSHPLALMKARQREDGQELRSGLATRWKSPRNGKTTETLTPGCVQDAFFFFFPPSPSQGEGVTLVARSAVGFTILDTWEACFILVFPCFEEMDNVRT